MRRHAVRDKEKKLSRALLRVVISRCHCRIVLPSLELRGTNVMSTKNSSAELLTGSGFAQVD